MRVTLIEGFQLWGEDPLTNSLYLLDLKKIH